MSDAKTTKPPIYLLDSMAFIFRAYHAMQRSRPMSTRTGIPTAATYVFVNMINKLRKDFQPEYLAAVYDVGAPVHRNEMAAQMKDVKKFNIKTQAFEAVAYGGYKANRVETPPDLIQQQPYIRRALEAFRIPILYYEGFEADDVIGTLSCKLAALGHHVYVVSSDKDMMQLVNKDVSILNPTKDNLILDPAGVEAALGAVRRFAGDVLRLRVKQPERIGMSREGIRFCGYRVWRGRILLSRRRQVRYGLLRAAAERGWVDGALDGRGLQAAYACARGLTAHADAAAWRRAELRRRPVAGALAFA